MKGQIRLVLLALITATLIVVVMTRAHAQQAPPPPPPKKVIRRIKLQHISPELLRLLLLNQTKTSTPPEPKHN